MTDELKPCPFCGGEARRFGGAGYHCIRCTKCGVTNEFLPDEPDGWSHSYETVDQAIEAWNDRPKCKWTNKAGQLGPWQAECISDTAWWPYISLPSHCPHCGREVEVVVE